MRASRAYSCKGCGAEFKNYDEFYTHMVNCEDFQRMQAREARAEMRERGLIGKRGE